MGAPKGNEFWKLVKNPTGRPKAFDSPEKMWSEACEYFQWCYEHPWVKTKTKLTDKGLEFEEIPVERPLTIIGCCLFMGIGQQTLSDYEAKKEFSGVVKLIKDTIYTQKFEGAAVGVFNANIIARDLGLADKQDITSNGKEIKSIIKFGGIEIEV